MFFIVVLELKDREGIPQISCWRLQETILEKAPFYSKKGPRLARISSLDTVPEKESKSSEDLSSENSARKSEKNLALV